MRALVVFLILLGGCARAQNEVPFSSADVEAHAELAAWLGVWTPPLSHLTASSFRLRSQSDKIGWPIDHFASGSSGFPPRHMERLLYSPDSTWAADMWFFQVDSSGQFLGEVDSHVALFNRVSGQAYQLLDCGTVCGFHATIWISASTLLVCGWEEYDNDPPGYVKPVIFRYDLQNQREQTYEGPPIGPQYVEAMGAAIHELWRLRFPWLRWEQCN